jgi:hypothetical protein
MYTLLLAEGQKSEAWERSKDNAVSEIGEHWIQIRSLNKHAAAYGEF